MSDFAATWSDTDVGDYIAVSDGKPMPSKVGGLPWRHWRSHNFVGRLVEKVAGEPRAMRFELATAGAAMVSYAIIEATPHDFSASDIDAFQEDVFVLT